MPPPRWSATRRLATFTRSFERIAPSQLSPLTCNFSRGSTSTAFTALDYIAAGDVFQVNLSQRFEARGVVDSLDLYLRLKARSPAPSPAISVGTTSRSFPPARNGSFKQEAIIL